MQVNSESNGSIQHSENWEATVQVNKVGQKFIKKFQTRGTDYFVRIGNLEGQNGERLDFQTLVQRLTVSLQ